MTENERLTDSNKEIPSLEHNEGFWLKVYFKLKDYEAIGTIEEFKALKEKSVAKKVVKWADGSEHCPCCDFDNSAIGYGVCIECGQKLDWE